MEGRRDTCGNCRAFSAFAGAPSSGECRRKSPSSAGFPSLSQWSWCLEHVPAPVTRKTLVNPVK